MHLNILEIGCSNLKPSLAAMKQKYHVKILFLRIGKLLMNISFSNFREYDLFQLS